MVCHKPVYNSPVTVMMYVVDRQWNDIDEIHLLLPVFTSISLQQYGVVTAPWYSLGTRITLDIY